jgi:citrate lyase subunit beta/citryl-CoA lyase
VARDQIAQAIAAGGFGKREVLIRVNSLDTPWWVDDVTMAGKARPDGILVPKISTVADLNAIANRLSDINADMSIRVWAMLETARAVLDADKLAARREIPKPGSRASCSDPMISRGRRGSACSRAARR